ncbi:MAG: hypothetical protein ACK56I_08990 [bacterium]
MTHLDKADPDGLPLEVRDGVLVVRAGGPRGRVVAHLLQVHRVHRPLHPLLPPQPPCRLLKHKNQPVRCGLFSCFT